MGEISWIMLLGKKAQVVNSIKFILIIIYLFWVDPWPLILFVYFPVLTDEGTKKVLSVPTL